MLNNACHITSPPAETEACWEVEILISIKVIAWVDQAPVNNLSLFDAPDSVIWRCGGDANAGCVGPH